MQDSGVPKNRTSALLKMAAKVALKEGTSFFQRKAQQRVAKLTAQANIVVKQVGQLKGAAMKAVQMITVEAHDLLPKEVVDILESLQSQAPQLSNETMKAVVKEELANNSLLLENLSHEPVAAASIGQVYTGVINDNKVVIKVQYPGVADSIDSDIKVLKGIINSLLFVAKKQINIDELLEEVKRVLKQETNYLVEAKNLVRFQQIFADEPNYIVPKLYPEFTTEKVIVMSFEDGLEISQWLKTQPTQEQRQKVGQLLLNLYIKEFFENRFVQTDPNPANFLVTKDLQLVLLDFGATIEYDAEFVKNYQQLLRSFFKGDKTEIREKVISLGFISERESEEAINEFVDFMKLSVSPFNPDSQPFDFTETEYSEQVRKSVLSFTKKIKYSPPPRQVIFLHRKLGGIFQILKKLEVKADLSPIRQLIIDKDYY